MISKRVPSMFPKRISHSARSLTLRSTGRAGTRLQTGERRRGRPVSLITLGRRKSRAVASSPSEASVHSFGALAISASVIGTVSSGAIAPGAPTLFWSGCAPGRNSRFVCVGVRLAGHVSVAARWRAPLRRQPSSWLQHRFLRCSLCQCSPSATSARLSASVSNSSWPKPAA